MSKKANPTVIGAFIVTGVVLLVAGVIVFKSGNLFSRKQKYILYFQGSMKGMNKGAPVQVKGVTIGSVLDVYIAHNQAPDDNSSPVIIEVEDAILRGKTDRRVDIGSKEDLDQMIAKGLRAKLDVASFVTGVLMVEFEFVQNAPPAVYHQIKPEYMEIPTVPTDIQVLLANLAKLDIQGIAGKLDSILSRLDTSLAALDMKAITAGVSNGLDSLHRTLDDIGALARKVDSRIDPLAESVTNTLAEANKALADARVAIQDLSTAVAPDAPLQTELTDALEHVRDAARSVGELAEFLKRNPNALITGNKPPQERP